MVQHVRDIMTSELVTVEPLMSVTTVAQKMRDKDIGVVLVTEGDELRGLVTDRDPVVRALAEVGDPDQRTVASACSGEVAHPDEPLGAPEPGAPTNTARPCTTAHGSESAARAAPRAPLKCTSAVRRIRRAANAPPSAARPATASSTGDTEQLTRRGRRGRLGRRDGRAGRSTGVKSGSGGTGAAPRVRDRLCFSPQEHDLQIGCWDWHSCHRASSGSQTSAAGSRPRGLPVFGPAAGRQPQSGLFAWPSTSTQSSFPPMSASSTHS